MGSLRASFISWSFSFCSANYCSFISLSIALANIPLCFGASLESGIAGDMTSAYAFDSAFAFSIVSIFFEYFPIKPASSSELLAAVSATGVGTAKTGAGFGADYYF